MSHFTGTALCYAEFRPAYPEELWDSLTVQASLNDTSKVLDLGAGPGTAVSELAHRAGHVVAVDLDPEMVEEGRRLTDLAGLANVEWINDAAEAIDYPASDFQLIIIASSFHWMNRPVVATKCLAMLADDGLLAVLSNPTPLMQIRDRTPIGAAIAQVQDRWFDDDFYVGDTNQLAPTEDILRACGFSDVTVSRVEQVQQWDVDRLVGFLRSTSSRPDQHLGDEFNLFAADIDRAIRAVEPSGRWTLEAPVQVITGRP